MKKNVCMQDGKFADGSPQSLYYPEGHEHVGVFKGMAVILEECGYKDALKLWAQCLKFKCEKGMVGCCCQRLFYNEPNFVVVESLLEIMCKACSFKVLFILKFHCELNFIEQCLGYSKGIYQKYPVTIPLEAMHW